MKRKFNTNILITFAILLLSLISSPASASTIDVGVETGTYTGDTRGLWFTAPEDFTITGLGLPTDASVESFDITVLRFPSAPPEYAATTTTFETLFHSRNNNQTGMIATNIKIAAGDIIGVLGSRGATSINSYGASDYVSQIKGSSVTLTRLLMQDDLRITDPAAIGVSSGTGGNIGRVLIEIDNIVIGSNATIDVGGQTGTYTGDTRGFWFTAPEDFTIRGLGLPTDASVENSDIAVLRFPSAPPEFAASTTTFETLFLSRNNNQTGMIATNIKIAAGDIIGVLGSRGATAINSYGAPNYVSQIKGSSVTLTRLIMQDDLRITDPATIGVSSGTGNIGRVLIDIAKFPWPMFLPAIVNNRQP